MKCLLTRLRRHRVQPGGPEEGFTLIEVMVAVLILMMAAVALAGVLTETVAAVSISRQSQQASNLASAALAEVEAMPWTTGSGLPNSNDANYGLTSSDVSSDANLTSDGASGYCFEGMHVVVEGLAGTGTCATSWTWANVASGQTCQSSLVALPSVTTGAAPLDPHVSCVVLNGTDFNLAVYPTQVVAGSAGVAVNLEVQFTAVVTWDGSATSSNGTDTRVTDTVIVCGATTGAGNRSC